MELLTWERQVLQLLVSLMDLMPYLQYPIDVMCSFPLAAGRICSGTHLSTLLHGTACYYTIMIPEGAEAR